MTNLSDMAIGNASTSISRRAFTSATGAAVLAGGAGTALGAAHGSERPGVFAYFERRDGEDEPFEPYVPTPIAAQLGDQPTTES